MNEMVMLRGAEPQRILQLAVEKKIQAIMCYLSRNKWHIAKILVVRAEEGVFAVVVLPPSGQSSEKGDGTSGDFRPRPVNIQVGQPVGISIKYDDGKFIFETAVVDFEYLPAVAGSGVILLELPGQMELVSRRSYFRVRVPEKLSVEVKISHRHCRGESGGGERIWKGRLLDISAGGLQVVMDSQERSDFREGQFVTVNFAPLASEAVIEFSAQVRNVLPTADGAGFCYGLQIVGLEASKEGRQTLGRLAGITQLYYELNRCSNGGRCWQIGVKAKTLVKDFREDWGPLAGERQ